jgi:hypothetical protein
MNFPTGTSTRSCGVLARQKQGQYKYFGIENAAAHLHGMVDALMGRNSSQ